jgi:putative ABC transport system substrate-binding protein
MKRRDFITLLGCAAVTWPLAAQAQRSERTARIGFLYPGPLAVAPPRIEIVLSGLRSAGRQGEQVELVPRVADSDPARLPRLAAELIEEKVDVVVAVSTAAVRAVQAASTTIPIVAHDLETDPVASGFIANYAQPVAGSRASSLIFPTSGRNGWSCCERSYPGSRASRCCGIRPAVSRSSKRCRRQGTNSSSRREP